MERASKKKEKIMNQIAEHESKEKQKQADDQKLQVLEDALIKERRDGMAMREFYQTFLAMHEDPEFGTFVERFRDRQMLRHVDQTMDAVNEPSEPIDEEDDDEPDAAEPEFRDAVEIQEDAGFQNTRGPRSQQHSIKSQQFRPQSDLNQSEQSQHKVQMSAMNMGTANEPMPMFSPNASAINHHPDVTYLGPNNPFPNGSLRIEQFPLQSQLSQTPAA